MSDLDLLIVRLVDAESEWRDCADHENADLTKLTIDRLRAERDRATAAEARVRELEAGLKPFAKYASENGFGLNHKSEPLPGNDGVGWVYLRIDDFRRARALLEDGK